MDNVINVQSGTQVILLVINTNLNSLRPCNYLEFITYIPSDWDISEDQTGDWYKLYLKAWKLLCD